MNDYRYDRLSDANFADLGKLIEVVYNVRINIEQLKKKYDTSCFGASYVGYIAYHNESNQPAGYYGILPLKVKLANNIVMAAQSGDTMTHPEHRNKGLFTELARHTYELGKSLGVQFVFGFPNKNSYHGLVNKLGWTHAYDMLSVNIFVPTLPYSSLLRKNASLSAWHSKAIFALLSKLFITSTALPEKFLIKEQETNGVIHDQDFFNYKLGHNCVCLQHKEVLIFVKVENNTLGIGAIHNYGAPADVKGALNKLKLICRLMGIIRIKTYCSPDSLSSTSLQKYGFSKQSLPFCYINFSAKEDLDTLNFTYFDYDTY